MKELSIEEKAKAYDELIKRLNKAREDVGGYTFKSVYDEVMSELAESEDEKIRKDMIDTIKQEAQGFPSSIIAEKSNKWIAWLEKQGEKGINGKNREIPFSEQKPAWSEEDDDNLSWLVEMLLGFDGNDIECYKDKKFIDKCKEVCKWLKAIKDRTSPQPKQEWGEEDECMLSRFFNCIGHYYADNFITKEQQTLMEDWLKSLRPQKQELSKEDDRMIKVVKEMAYTIAQTSDKQFLERHGTNEQELKNWSLSCSPQNAWKPSDEQIEILDMVLTNESMDDNVARILRELREQLRKLREG